MAKPDLNTG